MKYINKLAQAESKRQSKVNNWFIKNTQLQADRTITNLLEMVVDEESKRELDKITITLIKSIAKLKQQEHLNIELIEQSMQFVQLYLNMLNPSFKNLNYSNSPARKSTNDRPVFDSKA